MQILEYDDVDPFNVLDLNLLGFRFALTPELVATIRRFDPRPFPFLAIYAVDNGVVVGQVGVFRLPVMTLSGPEDIGGIWAMVTHPGYNRTGIGSLLLEEAHTRMRAASLRFSALGTSRHWVACPFYQRHGYQVIANFASGLNHRENLLRFDNDKLEATKATKEELAETDALFRQVARGKIGFARRHDPFMAMMIEIGDVMGLDDLRLLRLNGELVGYAVVRPSDILFKVEEIFLRESTSITDAVIALLRESQAPYVQITINSHSPHLANLRQAGFQVTTSTWDVVMIKSLIDGVPADDLLALTDTNKGQFMMSWMDVT